jgi:hypothetical protein
MSGVGSGVGHLEEEQEREEDEGSRGGDLGIPSLVRRFTVRCHANPYVLEYMLIDSALRTFLTVERTKQTRSIPGAAYSLRSLHL